MSLFWPWLTLIRSISRSCGLALEQGNISEKSLFMLCVNNLGPVVVSLFCYSMRSLDVMSSHPCLELEKTAWNAWLSYPHLTDTFIALLEDPETLDLYPGYMEHLEGYTVSMYGKNCNSDAVNEARKLLFTKSLKSLDSIPPTEHA